MFTLKKHIAVFSLLVFLLPTIISLHHVLENHEHSAICKSKTVKHIHKEAETSCKICDFTYVSFYLPSFKINLSNGHFTQNYYPNNYNFVTSYKKLFFSLRAPPALV